MSFLPATGSRMPAQPSRVQPGLAVLLVPVLLLVANSASAQQAPEGTEATMVYEREVFQYPAAERPDPFRSLLRDGDLGIRVEDLSLRGVVHHADPSQSVAFLLVQGSDRRIQARVGERVGSLRVMNIYPDRVDVVVEELGVSRRETLRIQSPPAGSSR
jgi:hypothetical protein